MVALSFRRNTQMEVLLRRKRTLVEKMYPKQVLVTGRLAVVLRIAILPKKIRTLDKWAIFRNCRRWTVHPIIQTHPVWATLVSPHTIVRNKFILVNAKLSQAFLLHLVSVSFYILEEILRVLESDGLTYMVSCTLCYTCSFFLTIVGRCRPTFGQ